MNSIILDSILSYSFMQRALIAIILIAFILPVLGVNVVTKRLSMIGDTISHTSLCGIAIGLASATLPIYMAIIASIIAGVIIEIIRNKFNKFSEVALSIVLSLSIAITSILTKFASGNRFESYLFGSIISIDRNSIYVLIDIFFIDIIYFLATYKINLAIGYNEKEAKASGLNVGFFNVLNMIIISASVAICSVTIGTLLVSSLLVIPVACSLKLVKKYSLTYIIAIIISLFMQLFGLFLSYFLNINTGGTIVLVGIFIFFLILLYKFIKNKLKR